MLDKIDFKVYNINMESKMEYRELILDMLNRIVKLEKEVALLKNNSETYAKETQSAMVQETAIEERPQQRDKTRYMFNGNIYLKNKLVFAVVKDYLSKNQPLIMHHVPNMSINPLLNCLI